MEGGVDGERVGEWLDDVSEDHKKLIQAWIEDKSLDEEIAAGTDLTVREAQRLNREIAGLLREKGKNFRFLAVLDFVSSGQADTSFLDGLRLREPLDFKETKVLALMTKGFDDLGIFARTKFAVSDVRDARDSINKKLGVKYSQTAAAWGFLQAKRVKQ